MIHEPTTDIEITKRPTQVEIDLAVIAENFRAISDYVGNQQIMWILKANAYGHGLVRIAQLLDSLGATYLGVAYLEEGIMLRKTGITTPILVMGGIIGNQIPFFLKYDLTMTASSVDKLNQIESIAEDLSIRAKVHLKIDTGMERIGIHYYSAEKLLQAAKESIHCDIEGIFTHLANADKSDDLYSRHQIRRFKKVLRWYKENDETMPLVHLGNSAGMLRYHDAHFNMVRVGLLLYGVYPAEDLSAKISVTPALSWKTRVAYFKVVQPNHPVSYGSTWVSKQMTRLVTLPVGYGDGYFRSMSNKAKVLIRGRKYDVIGNICMDQTMVNIKWETAYNDDEVVLIGHQNDEKITVEDLAAWAGTIPYEILTNINTRVPRVYK